MMIRAEDAYAALAALTGASADDIRRVLDEFSAKDIGAAVGKTVLETEAGSRPDVTDGETTVTAPPTIRFAGATVANDEGTAEVTVNGGSLPGALRVLDLGVVDITDLFDGPVTLYTPEAGEIIGPVFLRDVTYVNTSGAIAISREEQEFDDHQNPPLAGIDSDTAWDGFYGSSVAVGSGSGLKLIAPTTTGPVTAEMQHDLPPSQSVQGRWQANHAYDGSEQPATIIAAGHIWSTGDAGDSGGTEPDWPSAFASDIADNDLTWNDDGLAPSQGSCHVYAYVSVPAAP